MRKKETFLLSRRQCANPSQTPKHNATIGSVEMVLCADSLSAAAESEKFE